MRKKLLALIPYVLVLAVDFYLVPLLIQDTGSGMFILLFMVPFIAFICAVVYGVRQGFNGLLPLAGTVLFVPTIFIFYNESAWFYIIVYAAVIAIGNGVGRIFYKK